MAFTTANLAAAITATQTTFGLSSVSGSGLPTVGALPLPMGNPTLIDSEMMFIVSQPVSGTVVVRGRGSDGTIAAAHDILSNVYTSPSPQDFQGPVSGATITVDLAQDNAVTVGQDGAIPVPTQGNTIVNINKATAATLTLAAPPVSINAVELIVTSNTAAAHVVTATSLLQDGVAGSPHSTATFAALKGASMMLRAENGLWNVTALQNVTIS